MRESVDVMSWSYGRRRRSVHGDVAGTAEVPQTTPARRRNEAASPESTTTASALFHIDVISVQVKIKKNLKNRKNVGKKLKKNV